MADFNQCFQKIYSGGYYKKSLDLKLHMIDWKTIVDDSKLRAKLATSHIQSQINDARAMFNLCAPDVLQYLSPHFKFLI
jgi:hypothetical protein